MGRAGGRVLRRRDRACARPHAGHCLVCPPIDILALLDEVRAIATTGLNFTESPFDRERYERLLALAAHEYAGITQFDDRDVLARLRRELGYITTKVGAEAAIIDDDGRMLLVHRVDDGCWGLISGWVDAGESPHETVVRELREETGLEGVVDELVGVIARPASARNGPHGSIAVVFLVSLTGGSVQLAAHEVAELQWRDLDDVEPWHKNHEQLARAALAHWRARRGESGS
jgi:ADP-ribose pyrophosphatase YjhB (NUDIX family)